MSLNKKSCGCGCHDHEKSHDQCDNNECSAEIFHTEEMSAVDPLEQALCERDEAREKVLRVLAELENYRSRVKREREENWKYAEIDLLRDLLPVWDNLTRALESSEKLESAEKSSEKQADVAALLDGVRMVESQLLSVLEKHHCARITTVGEIFDPHQHASISQIATSEHEPNTIVYETQAGFKLHDRVVRPSQVVIAR